jgi:threonine dehydrogenase-like Zn-dependent dehydrogenase
MRALVVDGGPPQLVERRPPEPAEGTAVVRVTAAGICNTDLEIVRGYMGFRGVLGHEFVGVVVHGPQEWLGERVVAEINFGCGSCVSCTRGLQRHCPSRRVLGILNADGAFAEFVAVPVVNLHRVPEPLTDDEAVFTEPLAAAFEILEQVHVRPGMECTVLGDGKLGLLVAQVLQEAGAGVLSVGHHTEHLRILEDRGIRTVLADCWDQAGADVVVEATGTAAGFATAVTATRPRGVLVLKSTVADAAPVNLAPLVIGEITVVGSRCGPFTPALRALQAGSVDVRPLLSARFPLLRAIDGLQAAARPGSLKVLLDVHGAGS